MAGVKDFIAGLFEPAKDLVSELITDKDKALEIKAKLFEIQSAASDKMVEYETQLVKSKEAIIVAEASSESWLGRNWRPITMVVFVALIVAQWLGYTVEGISEKMNLALFDIIQLGLGGYVIGRSAEKIIPQVADIMTMNKK